MRFPRKIGFTLIELLIVVAIIGILARLVVISLNMQRIQARDASRRTALTQYGTAIEQYYSQAHSYLIEPAGCIVDKSADFYPDGTTYPLPKALPNGDTDSCVGYQGGGWGSINRRSPSADPSKAIGGYPGAESISEALRAGGYIQSISLDPRTGGVFPSQPASTLTSATFDDYILTLCSSSGRPASDPSEATEYGLYANLENAPSTSVATGTKATNSCGGPGTAFPWNTIQ